VKELILTLLEDAENDIRGTKMKGLKEKPNNRVQPVFLGKSDNVLRGRKSKG
jgi:hypothetical protein